MYPSYFLRKGCLLNVSKTPNFLFCNGLSFSIFNVCFNKKKPQIDFKYKAAAISSTNKNYSDVLLFLKQAWSHDYIKDTDVRGFFNFQTDMQTKYYSSGVQVNE